MNGFEYALNDAGWTLIGIVFCLLYQRMARWWRKRHELGHMPPVSSTAYFGSLLITIALISTLFSYSGRVHADDIRDCQSRINAHNVAVANERQKQQNELNLKQAIVNEDIHSFLPGSAKSKPQTKEQLKTEALKLATDLADYKIYNKTVIKYNKTHTSKPTSICGSGSIV